jgi:hypothetical protein
MATATNSLNINGNGFVAFNNTTGAFSETAMTQYNLLTGGASAQSINQIAPGATSGVPLISQGAAAYPIYGTAVVAGGGTGVTSLTAYAVVCGGTTTTGPVQSVASVGTSGQVLTSNGAGALPTFQTPSGGGGGVSSWVDVTGTSQAMAVNTGYMADNAGLVTVTLPATAVQFSVIIVSGYGAGGWKIAQNAAQQIIFGSSSTTAGVTGFLASTNQYDAVELLAVVGGASTIWKVQVAVGNITVN